MSTPRKKRVAIKPVAVAASKRAPKLTEPPVLGEVRELILTVAQAVNARLTVLHWQIGHRIHREILKEKRLTTGLKLCHHCRHNWRQSSDGDSAAGISST